MSLSVQQGGDVNTNPHTLCIYVSTIQSNAGHDHLPNVANKPACTPYATQQITLEAIYTYICESTGRAAHLHPSLDGTDVWALLATTIQISKEKEKGDFTRHIIQSFKHSKEKTHLQQLDYNTSSISK